ncbi:transposase family protein [Streptomyces atriruber]|uniref:Transposase family protein n=1 Tax=Streptomyces atriruber TaxID=545121 RepID=A0ABV3BEC8_9ACTN
MCRQPATVCLIKPPTDVQRAAGGIAERLASLVDPRARRGRRHSLTTVLLTCCCAVLAGARSIRAIGQWASNAPQETLARPLRPGRRHRHRRRTAHQRRRGPLPRGGQACPARQPREVPRLH